MADVLTRGDVLDVIRLAPTEVALFAYGTLRPGEALSRLVDTVEYCPGKVYGYGLYAVPQASYPHMAYDKHNVTVGDLLWVMPNSALMETVRMEMRAGYRVERVNVYTPDMEEPIPALTFTWPSPPFGAALLPGGDWRNR